MDATRCERLLETWLLKLVQVRKFQRLWRGFIGRRLAMSRRAERRAALLAQRDAEVACALASRTFISDVCKAAVVSAARFILEPVLRMTRRLDGETVMISVRSTFHQDLVKSPKDRARRCHSCMRTRPRRVYDMETDAYVVWNGVFLCGILIEWLGVPLSLIVRWCCGQFRAK